jgi:protein SCO1/2
MPIVRTLQVASLATVLLLALGAGAQAARWGKGYVPEHPVVAQDGKTFNFYEDLIKDRLAVISFIYTSCSDICPVASARLFQLQEKLGAHMGREVFFYSITVDPETDTPERMQDYAKTFGAGPGWLFLTGKPEHINEIRYRLGERSRFLGEHRNDLLLSNGFAGQWQRDTAMGDLDRLVLTIQSLNPAAFGIDALSGRPHTQLEGVELTGPPGETLYLKACAGCHSIGEGKRVGPDLAGVTQRRPPEWLKSFIANPAKVRASKDPIALELVAQFPTVRMPSIGVSEREAGELIAYIEARQARAHRQIPLQPLLALTTPDGKRLAADDVRGRPLAVAFGFTHCPDVCPTTLMDWSNVLASLGPDGDRIKVLFISVDPERDTPAALKSYMAAFDPRITALTGSPGELATVAAAFGAHYAKVAGKDGNFTFDHSVKTYILDRQGKLAGASDHHTDENRRRSLLKELVGRGEPRAAVR